MRRGSSDASQHADAFRKLAERYLDRGEVDVLYDRLVESIVAARLTGMRTQVVLSELLDVIVGETGGLVTRSDSLMLVELLCLNLLQRPEESD